MPVYIEKMHSGMNVDEVELERIAWRVLKTEGKADADVTIVFVDDEYIRELNRKFLKRDGPTDVLAFDMRSDLAWELPDRTLGEAYISLDSATEQAAAYGVSVREETARLVVHGLLHLLGYDHEAPADDRRMRAREDSYLCNKRDGQ